MEKSPKRILVCPLNWGIGHASRCVPIIRHLLIEGFQVFVAADKLPLAFLKLEFPTLEFVVFKGYEMRYSKRFFGLKLALSIPGLLSSIYHEHIALKQIIEQHKIDLIISDNRYGCWSKSIPSIFITHQLFIQSTLLKNLIQKINFWFLDQYKQVWVPDSADEKNLSGNLSHGKNIPKHTTFIGSLSRFDSGKLSESIPISYPICVLLSGPEPQRSLLEELLITQVTTLKVKCIFVRGLPNVASSKINTECITFKNHLPTAELKNVILASETIISRSGYSTVMDLAALQKKVIFIPTPGQTEQEYLANYFSKQRACFAQVQDKFDLKTALQENKNYTGFCFFEHPQNNLLVMKQKLAALL